MNVVRFLRYLFSSGIDGKIELQSLQALNFLHSKHSFYQWKVLSVNQSKRQAMHGNWRKVENESQFPAVNEDIMS